MRILYSKKLIFISKPRSGSTSTRIALDFHLDKKSGDFGVDIPNDGYHPHISAPYLISYHLAKTKVDISNFKIFTTIRNPIKIIKSYYCFFQPDLNNIYNYQKGHTNNLMPFDEWLIKGFINIEKDYKNLMPKYISNDNFSPISFEALLHNNNDISLATNYFLIEEPDKIKEFLGNIFGNEIKFMHTNKANYKEKFNQIKISKEALQRIKSCFPFESKIYNI